MARASHIVDPELDLVLERTVDVPRELVWKAWTTPEHVVKWFTPAPWRTVDCEIDLRPGGIFRTTMRSPEGQDFPHLGCYLEIVENEKLVWTNVFGPGYRPIKLATGESCDTFPFTAILTFAPRGQGTRYKALVVHGDVESCRKHAAMGFHEGWGKVLDQLVATIRTM